MKADLFKYRLRVRPKDWMLATVDEVVVKIFLISNVKITRQH